jgi:hypothetical protein
MTFPTVPVNTENLDSDLDNPSLARVDLLDAVQKLNIIINGAGTASNVALLNSSGRIDPNQIPNTISSTGTQIISPSTGVVNIQDILRLTALPVAEVITLTGNIAGDMVLCSNVGNVVANPGLAFYTDLGWRTLAFSSNTFANI